MYKTDTILTDREAQVVRGYVEGLNGKEIANRCCMAYRTVVNHTQNAFDKLGTPRSIHALVSKWYQVNFPEIAKQIGTACLLLLFSIGTWAQDDDYFRPTRGRMRHRVEYRARSRRTRTDETFEF